MVQHPTVLKIVREILGDDMQLGSIASNTIFPGGSGQEPHIDYPYWDYYSKAHWPFPPKHKDIPFNMNTQILIPLDDMTAENGATSVRPRSHIEIEYPTDTEEYRSKQSINALIVFMSAAHAALFSEIMSGAHLSAHLLIRERRSR